MKYIGVSDCKMQEGSMRSDVNISVRPEGSEKLGTRTEIKNMNSFTYMAKAMEYEINRQIDLVQAGGQVVQQTLRYNVEDDCTESMRGKEDADDYRYFREPDLVTISVSDEKVADLKAKLPELPDEKLDRYINQFGLPEADAQLLVKYRNIAEFFDAACEGVANPKVVANCILGQIFRRLENDAAKEAFDITLTAQHLKDLVMLLDNGKIKMNLLKATLEKMLDTGKPATDFISESDMGGVDYDTLKHLCSEAIANHTNAVADYRNGKEKALKSLLGAVMKATRGRADAIQVEKILIELIHA